MITAKFTMRDGGIREYAVKGHSEYAENGQDIVCSAVSSVSIMAANTITEVIKAAADVKSDDGYLKIILLKNNSEAGNLLEGLRLFLNELSQQYPEYLKVSMEV